MEKTQQGWIILSEDKSVIYDFTYSRTRTDAQHKWTKLWETPNNWKAHYNKGVRCVKAERIIILTK